MRVIWLLVAIQCHAQWFGVPTPEQRRQQRTAAHKAFLNPLPNPVASDEYGSIRGEAIYKTAVISVIDTPGNPRSMGSHRRHSQCPLPQRSGKGRASLCLFLRPGGSGRCP